MAIAFRGIHLDLKGLPPTPQRAIQILDVIVAAHCNFLLIEWEDMLPWTVDPEFRNATAYSVSDVVQLCRTARERGVEVVPLVQTLGHMETFLSLPRYRQLREIDDLADTLHPLAEGAGDLIRGLIDDVLRLIPNVRYFHLGGDEAITLGSHPASRKFIEQHGKAALYLKHIEPLLDHLASRGIRPILWHDMMHDWPREALARLASKADLMVWGYGEGPDETKGHYHTAVIERFQQAKVALWAATAYKGADGCTMDLPSLGSRAQNAMAWLQLSQRIAFKGIVATGWSRYSAHRPQNEPIDGALDAMLHVGAILHDGSPPPGGVDDCVRQLGSLGEGERFAACRDALAALSAARRDAWLLVQQLHEQIALEEYDAARRLGGHAQILLASLRAARGRIADASSRVRSALGGSVHPGWIEEYLHTRLAPIDLEIKNLSVSVKKIASQAS
jgi:hexosaminidase